jgi:hypothetical protein
MEALSSNSEVGHGESRGICWDPDIPEMDFSDGGSLRPLWRETGFLDGWKLLESLFTK